MLSRFGPLTSPIPQHGVLQSNVTTLWQVKDYYLLVVSLFFVCCLVVRLVCYLFLIVVVASKLAESQNDLLWSDSRYHKVKHGPYLCWALFWQRRPMLRFARGESRASPP